ncbi:CST complex subunit TEN1 isoform X1 [Entelurus aequoreus]|uniref:CST complex subunit TEN1 isoform X1 n=1 Tax=Entelurus aequoreus TaxID=161455 RepID=UPI002B1E1096|nr:CST complex subunit TEN1 isoform X1 [Entelurus aequoreus]
MRRISRHVKKERSYRFLVFFWSFLGLHLKCGLTCYEQDKSTATLTAQHASKDHHVVINTSLVEPFHPIIGAQYLVVGETETAAGVDMMVRARVLNCVDGVNIPRLQKAILEQRSFFKEREGQQNAT